MFWDIFLFVLGFYILVKGSGFLVDGSSSLAKNLGISNFVIGLVIVGIGTSIPEFAITFLSNITGDSGLGVGTVVGSNTFNILFILGVSAMFFPLKFKESWVRYDLLWNVLAVAAAILFFVFFGYREISRVEGVVMLLLFIAWLYISVKRPQSLDGDEHPLRIFAFPLAATMIFGGFVGVILGAKWVVDGGAIIAAALGMSEGIIGLTIVGIGTSLPELVVSFTAAYKRQPGIAVGNIIGSNIFDFLMIFGASALVAPIVLGDSLMVDAAITGVAALLLYLFMFWNKSLVLERWHGAVMVLLYVVYTVYILSRV